MVYLSACAIYYVFVFKGKKVEFKQKSKGTYRTPLQSLIFITTVPGSLNFSWLHHLQRALYINPINSVPRISASLLCSGPKVILTGYCTQDVAPQKEPRGSSFAFRRSSESKGASSGLLLTDFTLMNTQFCSYISSLFSLLRHFALTSCQLLAVLQSLLVCISSRVTVLLSSFPFTLSYVSAL